MQGQLLPTYQVFHICIVSVCINLPLLLLLPIHGEEDCLLGQQFLFLSCLFFGAAFPLGGACIILEYPDALGVFECPHLYRAKKIFNFDPCKIMISKHDLLKRLWAFVHSHLTPTLVCSVGAQQTSFRICSTDLCAIGRMGENINMLLLKLVFLVIFLCLFVVFFQALDSTLTV